MGLRADKKRKQRIAIERSILELVLEHGIDEATVDEVCARAEISKKTFFNYFPSKNAAILGYSASFPSEDELLATLAERDGECYLDVLVEAIGSRLLPGDDPEVERLRSEVFRTMPQLFFRGQREMHDINRTIARAVSRLLSDHPDRRLMRELNPRLEGFAASSLASGISCVQSMLTIEGGETVDPRAACDLVGELMGGREAVIRHLAFDAGVLDAELGAGADENASGVEDGWLEPSDRP